VTISSCGALGDIRPHRGKRARKVRARTADLAERLVKNDAGDDYLRRREVVGRGDPSIGETSDAPHARARAPAADPNREAALALRSWVERDLVRVKPPRKRLRRVTEVCSKHAQRLVESRPTLLEVDSDCRIVPRRRTRSHPEDQPTAREDVERDR
jgi:hypothetical protein